MLSSTDRPPPESPRVLFIAKLDHVGALPHHASPLDTRMLRSAAPPNSCPPCLAFAGPESHPTPNQGSEGERWRNSTAPHLAYRRCVSVALPADFFYSNSPIACPLPPRSSMRCPVDCRPSWRTTWPAMKSHFRALRSQMRMVTALEVTHFSIYLQVYFVNRLSGRIISGNIKVRLVLSQDDSEYRPNTM